MILLTDGIGTIVKSYEYDAFGREWDVMATDNNPFRYCGEYYDKRTETVYLRARYYDSAYGRFTQQDGWQYADANDPLSLNLYTYCWNNPVNMVDPSGHVSFWNKLKSAAKKVVAAVATTVAVAVVAAAVTTVVVAATAVAGPVGTAIAITATVGAAKYIASEIPDKETHYNRNENQAGVETQYETLEEYKKAGWEVNKGDACHQFTSEKREHVKYNSPDGKQELIFENKNDDAKVVTAPEDMGTYNFAPHRPKERFDIAVRSMVGHFIKDMVPWFIWGNTPEDTTTYSDRICSLFGWT